VQKKHASMPICKNDVHCQHKEGDIVAKRKEKKNRKGEEKKEGVATKKILE